MPQDHPTPPLTMHPASGLRVLELGSNIIAPYVGKLLVDAGADVMKVESPQGDPLRGTGDQDAPWFQFLNAGKTSVVLDLADSDHHRRLLALVADADLVLDDHLPADARALDIQPASLRAANPEAVVATLTRFGCTGPWADRPANDFTLQALVGSTDSRGVPGEEPVSVGGELGDFVAASLAAPTIIAATLAARSTGQGVHLDASQYEAMMWAFQVFRAIYEEFSPEYRPGRQLEIPSVEPAADGMIGYCTITGQQWHDFCAMIGAPEMADDERLASFDGRMEHRDEVWSKIHAFTTQHTTAELAELAAAFRIPVGPVGSGDKVTGFDQLVHQDAFQQSAHGFTQPRPAYRFAESVLAPPRPAPTLGGASRFHERHGSAHIPATNTAQPLAGVRVLDLTAFVAGPFATNQLRVLGAELIKVESHVRLDGMRWAGGTNNQPMWEFSPAYHGVNVGKTVVNLDLTTDAGREVLDRLIVQADVVIENFSPRVMDQWGFTAERIEEQNPRAVYIRMPAFGIDGPWRDRVGFAMTMEQVSGLVYRTGHADGPATPPKGPVDFVSGAHAAVAAILALAERERTGRGQLVEVPLINGALQAAAEQVVSYTSSGEVLTRTGNRSSHAAPQGLYRSATPDRWVAISVETEAHYAAAGDVVDGLAGLHRVDDVEQVDTILRRWVAELDPSVAAAALWRAGVPAAPAVHFNDSGKAAHLHARGFFQWADHPLSGPTPYYSYPVQIDGSHLPLGGSAPLLGQHSDAVLAGLGLTPDAIAALRDSGVTDEWPAMVPRPS